MSNKSERLLWGIVVHLVADWLFQNDWMASKKAIVGHPAGIVHASIHTAALCLVFPKRWALLLGVLHYIIDLRTALKWWRKTLRQTTDPANPASMHVAIWGDQVVHVAALAVVALAVTAQPVARSREAAA